MRGRAVAARRNREYHSREEESTVQGVVERQARPARRKKAVAKKKPAPAKAARPAAKKPSPARSPSPCQESRRQTRDCHRHQGARQGRPEDRRQDRRRQIDARRTGKAAAAKTAPAKTAPAEDRAGRDPGGQVRARSRLPPPSRSAAPAPTLGSGRADCLPRRRRAPQARARHTEVFRRPGAGTAASADLTIRRPVRAASAADPTDESGRNRHPPREAEGRSEAGQRLEDRRAGAS